MSSAIFIPVVGLFGGVEYLSHCRKMNVFTWISRGVRTRNLYRAPVSCGVKRRHNSPVAEGGTTTDKTNRSQVAKNRE